MLSSFETQYMDLKLFPLEIPLIQYNSELTSICVPLILSLFDPSRGV